MFFLEEWNFGVGKVIKSSLERDVTFIYKMDHVTIQNISHLYTIDLTLVEVMMQCSLCDKTPIQFYHGWSELKGTGSEKCR